MQQLASVFAGRSRRNALYGVLRSGIRALARNTLSATIPPQNRFASPPVHCGESR
jgi:hypothetical protein